MGNEQTLASGGAHRGKIGQRVAYAFGNLGQSAFYNALSTYFIVYVTSCPVLRRRKRRRSQTDRRYHQPCRHHPYRGDFH